MELENYIGTLTDDLIISQAEKGFLISSNFNKENVVQACYELTASNIYYDVSLGFQRIDISVDKYEYILIKPKQSIVIITEEELKIPNNVIGRVLTKGKLFSIGLLPINTYADPGFKGNLGIIFHNSSTNYLKINKGDSIAKIEFSVLQKPVLESYSGQHGYKTKIWPIPVEYNLTEKEIASDKRINSAADEIEQIYGSKYSAVIKNLLRVEKVLIVAAIFYLTFSLLLFAILYQIDKEDKFNHFFAVSVGLVTNIISAFFLLRLEKHKWFNGK